MQRRTELAQEAIAQALRVRKRLRMAKDEAICPLDAAESLGLEVRFVDIPSMEGIYVNGDAPAVILSSLRPYGRRHFTCAHEIGHHIFGHGQKFDPIAVKSDRNTLVADEHEFMADCFAAHFLMPRTAVESGMKRRNLVPALIEEVDIFKLASWLGVGYGTLVAQMQYGLGLLSAKHADRLRKRGLESVRNVLTGRSTSRVLHFADSAWQGRALDCEIGDELLVPIDAKLEGLDLEEVERFGDIRSLKVLGSGVGRISYGEWGIYARACKSRYVGRACFRFEEEVD